MEPGVALTAALWYAPITRPQDLLLLCPTPPRPRVLPPPHFSFLFPSSISDLNPPLPLKHTHTHTHTHTHKQTHHHAHAHHHHHHLSSSASSSYYYSHCTQRSAMIVLIVPPALPRSRRRGSSGRCVHCWWNGPQRRVVGNRHIRLRDFKVVEGAAFHAPKVPRRLQHRHRCFGPSAEPRALAFPLCHALHHCHSMEVSLMSMATGLPFPGSQAIVIFAGGTQKLRTGRNEKSARVDIYDAIRK